MSLHLHPPPSPGQNKPVSKCREKRLGRGPSEAKRGWCAQRALRVGCGSPGAAQRCPAGHRAPGSTGRHPGLTPFWWTLGSPFPTHPRQQPSSPACFLAGGGKERSGSGAACASPTQLSQPRVPAHAARPLLQTLVMLASEQSGDGHSQWAKPLTSTQEAPNSQLISSQDFGADGSGGGREKGERLANKARTNDTETGYAESKSIPPPSGS